MARRRRKSNPRRRKNAGLVKMVQDLSKKQILSGFGVSVGGVALGAFAWHLYGDKIMAMVHDMKKDADKAGLGALHMNPLHMGALHMHGAEGAMGAHGHKGAHSYGALAFSGAHKMNGAHRMGMKHK